MRLQLRMMVALGLFAATLAAAAPAKSGVRPIQVPGTYSNLQYNEEGGDLLGIEIKVVPVVGGRMQAAVLVSEGEPAPLVIADVHVSDNAISFKVPENVNESWTFRGVVRLGSLRGTITYASGRKEEVTLQRRCGYWDH